MSIIMSDYFARISINLKAVRAKSPLVHNITNFVAMPVIANSLLSLGASPIMAHAHEELQEIVDKASVLVLNIGTLTTDWFLAMHVAVEAARHKNIPIVLDPVGAGASRFRTRCSLDLLTLMGGGIVRGNASEILALAGETVTAKGVDSTVGSTEATAAAVELALKHACTVCVSGEIDFICNGKEAFFVTGGSAMMTKVTGLGCTASAIIGAFAGSADGSGPDSIAGNNLWATLSAMAVMSLSGSLAAKTAKGPGTFYSNFLDSLFSITGEEFAEHVTVKQAIL